MNKVVAFFCIVLLWISCGDSKEEFSSVRCYLLVNNQEHQDATLASAMNPASPGVFCLIQQTMKAGAPHFFFKNNQGSQSLSNFHAKEQRMHFIIGYNNGVIVGYGNLDQPAIFYAYDYQCPNCFDWRQIPRKDYPLSCSSMGIASCKACHRTYNLNTGGNIVQGEPGYKLTRYRATTTGPHGVLSVN
jgi:hypothetical protein